MEESRTKSSQTFFALIKTIINSVHYYRKYRKNFYSLRLLPTQRLTEDGKTMVKVRQFGNQNHFYMPVHELFDNDDLLEKFHPRDISRISLITFGELIFNNNRQEPLASFEKLRNDVMNSIEGAQ